MFRKIAYAVKFCLLFIGIVEVILGERNAVKGGLLLIFEVILGGKGMQLKVNFYLY